tara:strand:- start:1656 stop:2858 length:1203 start_codon:yes stop_codon:yes gene_type:complete
MRIHLFCFSIALLALGNAQDWTGFRGDGTSRFTKPTNLPVEWSDTRNLAWSQDLPGYGQSSPVIWGDQVFVTSADGKEKERLIIASFDLETGNPLWQGTFPASVKIGATDMVSRGAPTPVVDENCVYAFFESGDLIALNHEGERLWQRSLTSEYGEYEGGHGLGSSLAATNETLIVLADHQGASYLLSIDKKTGENVWKVDRESRISWTSPVVIGDWIWITSNGIVETRKTSDGSQVWAVEGMEGNTVASASVSPDQQLVVIGCSAPGQSQAISRDGAELWRAEKVTSSFGSPLVYDGCAYFVSRAGALRCNDLADGSLLWETRLSESCWASPVSAGGLLYFFCKDGTTFVLKPNREEPEILAQNKVSDLTGDRIYGVALTSSRFIARTGSKLVCIAIVE